MKKSLQRVLSLVLAVFLLIPVAAPAMTASAASSSTNPIVYVQGRRTPIYNKSGKKIYPLKKTIPDKLVEDSGALLRDLSAALISNNWDPYCKTLYNSVAPLYEDLVLDQNGNVKNGSYAATSPEPAKVADGKYLVNSYVFQYDSRLDPWETAAKLETYITKVQKVTGAKKVGLVGRCLGSSIVAAYLTRYGAARVDNVLLYAAACNGILPIGAAFAGKVKIDANALSKYTDQALNDEESFNELIKALVALADQARILGASTESINSLLLRVMDQILPDLLLATYATMPCYWSMVSDEYYAAAKKYIFKNDTKKYAGLIKKIDNYHNNVQKKLPTTLKNLKKSGVKISVISKYNVRLAPVFENSNIQADGTVELKTMSFGATSSVFGKTLSKSYLENVASAGLGDYVSKDCIIDASTCLFPDSTWFIKNNEHTDFPSCVNKLIYDIFSSKGQYTVKSSKSFPQFMEYKDKALVPVTTYNPDDIYDEGAASSGPSANMLVALLRAVSTIFGVFMKIISGIVGGFIAGAA